jgi:Domain of unknown function (DUF4360)
MFTLMTAALLALSSTVAPAASAAPAAPPADSITISVATVNGSGCPLGTAAVALSPDSQAFTVTYSDYLAQAGGGNPASEARKNCQLALRT